MKNIIAIIATTADGWCSVAPLNSEQLEYGIMGEGRTPIEAVTDFENVYQAMKEQYAKLGRPFTEVKFSYAFDTRGFIAYYSKFVTLAGMERLTGVNQRQLSHYINGTTKPSATTSKKIIEGMQRFFSNNQVKGVDICFA